MDFMGLSSDYLKLMVFLEFLIISGICYEQYYKKHFLRMKRTSLLKHITFPNGMGTEI